MAWAPLAILFARFFTPSATSGKYFDGSNAPRNTNAKFTDCLKSEVLIHVRKLFKYVFTISRSKSFLTYSEFYAQKVSLHVHVFCNFLSININFVTFRVSNLGLSEYNGVKAGWREEERRTPREK